MDNQSIEIICPACGKETLLRRTPQYDGFKRTGEQLSCVSCGHVFADEADVPFKKKKTGSMFNQDNIPERMSIFNKDETARLCRFCAHYIVNPFVQRCSHFKKEVEATDTCDHFMPKEKKPPKPRAQ